MHVLGHTTLQFVLKICTIQIFMENDHNKKNAIKRRGFSASAIITGVI